MSWDAGERPESVSEGLALLDHHFFGSEDPGASYLRADSFRENADDWFDRQMAALEEFEVTLTFCFTPEHRGIVPHYTSAPIDPQEFAGFCARMTERYGARRSAPLAAAVR